MPQGAKYYVYPAAVLKVIKKYIKLHTTITEKRIIEYKMIIRIQAKVACKYLLVVGGRSFEMFGMLLGHFALRLAHSFKNREIHSFLGLPFLFTSMSWKM